LAEETEVPQKPVSWKKDVIIGGAVLGGLAAWNFAGTHHPGADIVIGVIVGAWVASWVWDMANEDSCDEESRDQKPGDRASGHGKS